MNKLSHHKIINKKKQFRLISMTRGGDLIFRWICQRKNKTNPRTLFIVSCLFRSCAIHLPFDCNSFAYRPDTHVFCFPQSGLWIAVIQVDFFISFFLSFINILFRATAISTFEIFLIELKLIDLNQLIHVQVGNVQ